MLLRFRVANYASIRDEADLSMVAVTSHEEIAVRPINGTDLSALPAAAIYGANASGKSSVVDALIFMTSSVVGSHQTWSPGAPTKRRAFRLDTASRQQPTRFAVDFVLGGVRYEYGFSVDDHRVTEEWLFGFPRKRTRILFERAENNEIKFGQSLAGPRESVARLIRPNSLYLSAAAANNHPQLSPIYNWFAQGIFPVTAGRPLAGSSALHIGQHHAGDPLRSLLRYADTGIVDLATTRDSEISFMHRNASGVTRLSIDEESSGTLAWLQLAGPVTAAVQRGGLLVVDDLDAHLHPLLASHLVGIFQDPGTNRSGAQLLFTAHNTTLLSPSAPGRLRRDQVWFTEKDDSGATSLFALAEFRARNEPDNIEKRYLNGSYGAIPFQDETTLETSR
jgi:hypothetical protein